MKTDTISAHSPGYCTHAYTGDGEKIVTCGYDSHIRLYVCATLGTQDTESQLASSHEGLLIESGGDSLTCVAAGHPSYFASGSDDGTVVLYRHADGSMERHLLRKDLAIRSLSFHPMGHTLAVAGDELDICLVDLSQQTTEGLEGHGHPIQCVAYDPLGKYLGSVDAAGTLKIWHAASSSPYVCLKTLTGMNAVVTDHAIRFTFDWSPDGQWIALPSYKDIRLFEVFHSPSSGLNLKEGKAFTLGHTSPVSGVKWSPKAQYLASHAQAPDHTVILWHVETREVALKYRHDNALTSLAWKPLSRAQHPGLELTLMDQFGQLQMVRETGLVESLPLAKEGATRAEKRPAQQKSSHDVLEGLFDIESKPSQQRKQKQKRSRRSSHSDQDDVDSEQEDDSHASLADDDQQSTREKDEGENESGSESDNENESRKADQDDYQYEPEDDLEHLAEHAKPSRKRRALTAQGRPVQPAFQPSATPMKYKRQFLVWNLIGTIVARVDNAGLVNMDVEFHDKSQHRPLHFADPEGYTMASLSERAALFASKQSCHYIPFGAWAPKSDWTFRLESTPQSSGEQFCAIAVGKKWAALATQSPSNLRILSSSGLQSCLFSLPSKVVAMAAARSSNALLILMESEVWVYDMELRRRLYQGQLPSAERALIVWLGFVDWTLGSPTSSSSSSSTSEPIETPVYMDSRGLLRALMPQWGHVWTPILDTKTIETEKAFVDEEGSMAMVSTVKIHHWPIGVTPEAMVCVVVKGDDPFPIALPRPPSTAVKLKLPLMPSHSAALEQRWLLSTLFPPQDSTTLSAQLSSDKLVLEMIKMALDTDRSVRVLDLCLLLNTEKSFEFAIQLAQYKRMMSLAEKMDAIRRIKLRPIWDPSFSDTVSSERARASLAIEEPARPASTSSGSIVIPEMTATALKAKLKSSHPPIAPIQVHGTLEEPMQHAHVVHSSPIPIPAPAPAPTPTPAPTSESSITEPLQKKKSIMNPFAAKLSPLTTASEDKLPSLHASPSMTTLPLANAKLGQFFTSKPQPDKECVKKATDTDDKENTPNEAERTHQVSIDSLETSEMMME